MLQLIGSLLNHPVLSLHTGGTIGTVEDAVINPNNLKIEGFYCQEQKSRKTRILLSQDVRDIIPQGIVVNDQEALTDPSDLVRLKSLIDLNFKVIDKHVITTDKQKIGKVNDYSVEIDGLFIQKLYVTQPLFKNLGGGNLVIDRSQIVEVTNRTIVINELRPKIQVGVQAVA